ncbi:MAG: molybdopterin-dependent oxidoreductase [Syntrophobacteria bacterium]
MEIPTACTLGCPDGCSLLVSVQTDGTIRIRGNPHHPVTAGFTCPKIRHFAHRLHSPDRITRPMLRKRGSWMAIEWEEALGLCAEKLQHYRKQPESILQIHGHADKGILSLASDLFFAGLGTTRVRGSLCDGAGIAACITDFGSLDSNDILDLANARWIVNWGKDLGRSSTHVAALVRRARQKGARVLTVSPGGDDNRNFSDISVRIRPGTDRFLALAVTSLLLERDMIPAKILKRTRNSPAFLELIAGRSLSELAAACGVTRAQVEQLFSFYRQAEPVATLIGWGLQRYQYGGENIRFINALALLSGNIGLSAGGIYFNISSKRNFNLHWIKDLTGPSARSLRLPTIGRDILQAKNPPIHMIWVNCCNIANQAPDAHETARAFRATEFKVVVDAFMTDTAEHADLFLPCALMLEKEDIVGSFLHNYVQYARPVRQPPGQARSDYWILSELGKRVDPPILLPPADRFMRACLDSPYLDITLEDLRQRGFIRAKRPAVAYADLHFANPDGKYNLPTSLHKEPSPSPEFPLRLLTLIRREFLHSQILPHEHEPVPPVWIAPDNPALQELDLDKDVFLASPQGRLKVEVNYAPDLHSEAVVYRRGDWMKLGGGVNQLIAARVTDMGDGAAFYSQWVRLEN